MTKIFRDSSNTFHTLNEDFSNSKVQFDPTSYKSKKALFNLFYASPAHFLQVDKPAFTLRINPIIEFKYGTESSAGTLFENKRGIDLRGTIDEKIYFQSRIIETQSKFPDYVNRFIKDYKSLPGNGLYKTYNSDIFNIRAGYDFLNADASVGFNFTEHVGTQLGYGKHFIGNGIRSLFLSDFSNNYFFLRLNTQIWKFHYQNIFGELNNLSPNFQRGDQLVPKKYFAAHYLGFKLHQNLDIGVFETVVFNRNQFEFQYLNPIILYRSVEHNLGSPDNVLIGLDVKWNLWNTMSIYGQLMLDEFKFKELITDNQGWWANKYGIQLGAKYLNMLGIDQLDGHIEFNTVRPYTYSQ